MPDEGFHEIELKGKQLVFLFMAGTVVSVVIFLCGVMVGRGVRTPVLAADAGTAQDLASDPTAVVQAARPALSDSAPVSTQEALTYDERLEADRPLAETLRPPVEPAVDVPDPPAEPVPADRPEPARADPDLNEPAGDGYVVQVMASTTREEAESVARRLEAKGYSAFVTTTDGASAYKFRVRVGKFNNIREAEVAAERLKREEQFNTWTTR